MCMMVIVKCVCVLGMYDTQRETMIIIYSKAEAGAAGVVTERQQQQQQQAAGLS